MSGIKKLGNLLLILVVCRFAYLRFGDLITYVDPNSMFAHDSGWKIEIKKDKLTDGVFVHANKTYKIQDGTIQVTADCKNDQIGLSFDLFRRDKEYESYETQASDNVSFEYRLDNAKAASAVKKPKYKNSIELTFLDMSDMEARLNRIGAFASPYPTIQRLVTSKRLLVRLPLSGAQQADIEIQIVDLNPFFEQCPLSHAISGTHLNNQSGETQGQNDTAPVITKLAKKHYISSDAYTDDILPDGKYVSAGHSTEIITGDISIDHHSLIILGKKYEYSPVFDVDSLDLASAGKITNILSPSAARLYKIKIPHIAHFVYNNTLCNKDINWMLAVVGKDSYSKEKRIDFEFFSNEKEPSLDFEKMYNSYEICQGVAYNPE